VLWCSTKCKLMMSEHQTKIHLYTSTCMPFWFVAVLTILRCCSLKRDSDIYDLNNSLPVYDPCVDINTIVYDNVCSRSRC